MDFLFLRPLTRIAGKLESLSVLPETMVVLFHVQIANSAFMRSNGEGLVVYADWRCIKDAIRDLVTDKIAMKTMDVLLSTAACNLWNMALLKLTRPCFIYQDSGVLLNMVCLR